MNNIINLIKKEINYILKEDREYSGHNVNVSSSDPEFKHITKKAKDIKLFYFSPMDHNLKIYKLFSYKIKEDFYILLYYGNKMSLKKRLTNNVMQKNWINGIIHKILSTQKYVET